LQAREFLEQLVYTEGIAVDSHLVANLTTLLDLESSNTPAAARKLKLIATALSRAQEDFEIAALKL
jgi:hypothetical protein